MTLLQLGLTVRYLCVLILFGALRKNGVNACKKNTLRRRNVHFGAPSLSPAPKWPTNQTMAV
ncbi:Uncharacterized protein APZ42_023320 [Daphnia magna]|uniref:Uncharacterized protein n=1 Tax=Daphnia magna TaxID=35525 RepID=A0A164V1T5_9CRUS|nr:Uncharacterized protein APZ42_023320 [Daphnia magna]